MSSQGGQTAAGPPAKGKAALVLVGAGVLALAGAGVVAYRKLAPQQPSAAGAPRKVAVEPGVLELETFVQNLVDPAGSRYLRLGVRIVLDQRAAAERGEHGLGAAKLRDAVLSYLARQRGSELASAEAKERLREELRAAVEPLLAEPPFHDPDEDAAPARVLDVLFTEFLLQ